MKYILIQLWVIACIFLGLACQEQEQRWISLLPEGKADLLIVLKEGSTAEEIRRFEEEELITGDLEKGFSLRPGLRGIMGSRVDKHEAFAVVFDPSASSEQRAAIRQSIMRSRFVYRVFENVAPEDVVLKEPQKVSGQL